VASRLDNQWGDQNWVSLQQEYTLLFLEILASLFIFNVFADNSLLASKLERVEGSWFSLILDG
jgi:hypothetical protein